MGIQIVETLATLLKELQKYGATETVIGKELHIGEVTIVPITKISIGVGAGSGTKDTKSNEGSGSGGGGGLKMEPIAFLVVHGDKVSLLNINSKKGPLETLSQQVPELLDKWIEKHSESKKAKEEKINNK